MRAERLTPAAVDTVTSAAWLAGRVVGYGRAGGMIEALCACCQLPPLLMPGLSVFLVSVSLSPTPVGTGSERWHRGKGRGDWWAPRLALTTGWSGDAPACIEVTTDECQLPVNSRTEKKQGNE